TYLCRTLIPCETGSPESWSGQYGSQISQVLRPRSSASARSNHEVRKGHISSSACAAVHPLRSNPPRRSSSGPPGPWYTPSKVSIIDAVSFMVMLPARVAPAVGFEPTTMRLTAARSTTELRRNRAAKDSRGVPQPLARALGRDTFIRGCLYPLGTAFSG